MTISAAGELVDFARGEVSSGRLPALSLAVGLDGKLLVNETIGAPVGTRFLLWSCTKAFVAGGVWLLVSNGSLSYDDRVVDHIPEFDANGKDAVRVSQLLTHTAGFPSAPLGPPRWITREGRLEAFGRWRLNWEPGTQYTYHPYAAHWVLVELIERLSGMDYRAFLTERISVPLSIGLQLGVPIEEQANIATLISVGEKATPQEHAAAGLFAPVPSNIPSGSGTLMNDPELLALGIPAGGGVGTAGDLALFYQALLHNPGGLWDDEVLADAVGNIRCTFPDPEREGIPSNRTAGLVVRGDHDRAWWMMRLGRSRAPRRFGHDGAGGQVAWADPDSGLSFAFLSNGLEANRVTEELRGTTLTDLAAACA